MQKLGLNEIRERYLAFFEGKEHLRLQSASLVPRNDKSLLIINSGMAPLKPYFTGQEAPPSKRITTCQKCFRTNDIENVGKTSRHATFFEMLGNFSFGDYFKHEIIPWAWEFLTKDLEIPESRLYPSVYEEDDEAFDIWHNEMGIAKERIFRLGKDDNFWEVGLGPCGPCSEIYFDRGEKYGCGKHDCQVGCECDRFIEIWNLVFTQFSKEEDGSYSKLTHPNIDTGMGLERVSLVMQDVESIFDIDTFKSVRDVVCNISGVPFNKNQKTDESIRIITDHARAVTFMAADGIIPSNEGRGYLLRRLLRRAARHGKLLGIKSTFLSELVKTVVEISKSAYPEIFDKQEYILKLISVEEDRFYETIDQGIEMIKKYTDELKISGKKTLAGTDAFKLYDTYGIPIELIAEIVQEDGITIDEEGFSIEMENQKERGRSAREKSNYMGSEETILNKIDVNLSTEFLGYNNLVINNAKIISVISKNEFVNEVKEGAEIAVVLDKTVMYAESGGQTGDQGIIKTGSGEIRITDSQKTGGNKIIHFGKVISGKIENGQAAEVTVDSERRKQTARNHSATHLLQKALREVLGNHVEQAGSYVSYERLRFDFTHFSALTSDELNKVEERVNEKILEAISIESIETTVDEAKKTGAMALFGEKYGALVRMVNMSGYSVELCGGTHLTNTAQIGSFKLLSENGVAAGVRRIEAVTGVFALAYYSKQNELVKNIASAIKATEDSILVKLDSMITHTKDLSREIEKLKSKLTGGKIDDYLTKAVKVREFSVLPVIVSDMDLNAMRNLGDQLKDKIKSGVILLCGNFEDKNNLLVMATEDAVKSGINAGLLVKEIAPIGGGSGGGRPNMAQAGYKLFEKSQEMMDKAIENLNK